MLKPIKTVINDKGNKEMKENAKVYYFIIKFLYHLFPIFDVISNASKCQL